MKEKCLKCGKESSACITLLDSDAKYYVCRDHFDISINEILEDDEKQAKIRAHIEQLKSLGINVNIDASGLAIASNEKNIEKVEKPIEKPIEKPKTIKEAREVKKSVKLEKVRNTTHNVDGNVVGGNNIDIDNEVSALAGVISEETGDEVKLPQIKDIEYQEVTGVAGTKMRVPKRIKHDDGISTISVVKTSHTSIMDKFRADNVEGNERSFKQGYTTRDCTSCGGSGKAKIGSGKCPKCGGIGVII